jgi:hypothetical protein
MMDKYTGWSGWADFGDPRPHLFDVALR